MKLLILNGPNLNLLGTRDISVYGAESFDSYYRKIKSKFSEIDFEFYQSNVEGELIDKLHQLGFTFDGVIFNAGGYTHTSVAIADAIEAIAAPVIEVHISNVYSREEYRHISLMAKNCKGVIAGLGLHSYDLAIQSFIQ
mgnify:CR=1 FL=1|tara:strand:+ start:369 stop:785 length:417 start_codon:yes stop_codon:yes gene_type:complete